MDAPFLTYGIVTDGKYLSNITMVINSILNQGILFPPEIIVVGDKETCNYLKSKFQIDLKYIEFDESQMPGWITKKKNMITEMALGDYIVYVHDYVTFSQGWHNAVLSFLKKTRVDVAITEILDYKGNRYADWILHPLNYRLTDLLTFPNKCLLPYDKASFREFQYISGCYFLGRKDFMKRFPFNESLVWGQGEDVEWSFRWRSSTARLSFIPDTNVKLVKEKETKYCEITGVRLLIYRLLASPLIAPLVKSLYFDVRRFRRIIKMPDGM